MKRIAKWTALAVLAAGGGVLGVQLPAAAYAYCERYASAPTFSGSSISGFYRVDCTRTVATATLYGRLKEDRVAFPDSVIDTEWIYFTNDNSDFVQISQCRNQNLIYTEAQINSESPTQSSRRSMYC